MAEPADQVAETEVDRDVCKLVHRLAHSLDAQVRRAAEELGLTAGQVVALRELSEPITARELATRMLCEPSNATYILDRLEQQQLIERRPHPTDRRAKQIVLTADGRSCRAKALEQLRAQSPLAPLTAAQQDSLRDLLQSLASPKQPRGPAGR